MADVKNKDKRVHAIADAIKPNLTIEDKKFLFSDATGQAAVDAFNAEYKYAEDAPVLSLDLLKAADEFYTDLEPAIVHAGGNAGVDAMKADAGIETLKGTLQIGTTDFVVSQQRDYSSHNPQFGKQEGAPERIEKSGRMTIKRDVAGTTAYKRAVEAVCAYGADVL